ncbi:MAG TPA: hypothetical protein PLV52_03395, partial [Candidatus Omnitrophota bacterium]|nr:hypothetical protein [Candidatus Omnitrophota bacterium]
MISLVVLITTAAWLLYMWLAPKVEVRRAYPDFKEASRQMHYHLDRARAATDDAEKQRHIKIAQGIADRLDSKSNLRALEEIKRQDPKLWSRIQIARLRLALISGAKDQASADIIDDITQKGKKSWDSILDENKGDEDMLFAIADIIIGLDEKSRPDNWRDILGRVKTSLGGPRLEFPLDAQRPEASRPDIPELLADRNESQLRIDKIRAIDDELAKELQAGEEELKSADLDLERDGTSQPMELSKPARVPAAPVETLTPDQRIASAERAIRSAKRAGGPDRDIKLSRYYREIALAYREKSTDPSSKDMKQAEYYMRQAEISLLRYMKNSFWRRFLFIRLGIRGVISIDPANAGLFKDIERERTAMRLAGNKFIRWWHIRRGMRLQDAIRRAESDIEELNIEKASATTDAEKSTIDDKLAMAKGNLNALIQLITGLSSYGNLYKGRLFGSARLQRREFLIGLVTWLETNFADDAALGTAKDVIVGKLAGREIPDIFKADAVSKAKKALDTKADEVRALEITLNSRIAELERMDARPDDDQDCISMRGEIDRERQEEFNLRQALARAYEIRLREELALAAADFRSASTASRFAKDHIMPAFRNILGLVTGPQEVLKFIADVKKKLTTANIPEPIRDAIIKELFSEWLESYKRPGLAVLSRADGESDDSYNLRKDQQINDSIESSSKELLEADIPDGLAPDVLKALESSALLGGLRGTDDMQRRSWKNMRKIAEDRLKIKPGDRLCLMVIVLCIENTTMADLKKARAELKPGETMSLDTYLSDLKVLEDMYRKLIESSPPAERAGYERKLVELVNIFDPVERRNRVKAILDDPALQAVRSLPAALLDGEVARGEDAFAEIALIIIGHIAARKDDVVGDKDGQMTFKAFLDMSNKALGISGMTEPQKKTVLNNIASVAGNDLDRLQSALDFIKEHTDSIRSAPETSDEKGRNLRRAAEFLKSFIGSDLKPLAERLSAASPAD